MYLQANIAKARIYTNYDYEVAFALTIWLWVAAYFVFCCACPQHSRGRQILALVPRVHAQSDASDQSESECELHDTPSHYSSSPAPSITDSLKNLNIWSDEDEALPNPSPRSPPVNEPNPSPRSPPVNEPNPSPRSPTVNEHRLDDIIPAENFNAAIFESMPLTPILQEIQEYDNVPSISALSLPSSPATPLAPQRKTKNIALPVKRKTRSKQPIVPAKRKRKVRLQLAYKWKKCLFRHAATIEKEDGELVDLPGADSSPLTFFQLYFSKDLIEDIVNQTNFYSVQETGKSILLTEEEFSDFLAIHIMMGIVEMPAYLDYWSHKFKYAKVAEIMPLKRYQQIRRYLHFANNNMDNGDRYYKVRPLLEKIRLNCLKYQGMDTRFSIDEMMIAYKGSKAGKRKQYMKDKPNKWGFKNYVRAGVSGIIYDFVMYGGEDTFRYHTFSEEEESLGFGAQIVLALCQSIIQKPAIIYCDNFFTSPELFFILRQNYGIFALGTIRNNRLRGAEKILPSEKDMKKKERGAFAEVACNDNRLAVVRWNDNKAVTFLSSFVASSPVEKIMRYSKDAKKKIDVQCPQIVRQYNKNMGGVDLADMLISLYKIPLKSRRWYLGIFVQMLDICLNNAWLLHRTCNAKKSQLSLKAFRFEVFECLRMENRTKKRQKMEECVVNKPRAARPCSPVKYDNTGHFPSTMDEGRCRYCKKKTVVFCIKCNMRLCFVTGKNARNCFLNFHTK